MFFKLHEPLGFCHVNAIGSHILANNCFHPPLKEFILEERQKVALPCYWPATIRYKHIVECWGVHVLLQPTTYIHPV